MASNITNMSHTKHMDIEYKYMNEYIQNEAVTIIFV